MLRLCLWLLLTLPLAAAPWSAAHAQPKPSPQASPPQAATPFDTLSPEQARAALDTLNDPKKRAAAAATLEAIVKSPANPADPPAASPPPAPASTPAASPPASPAPAAPAASPIPSIAIQLEPNSLGAQVLLTASAFLSRTATELSRGVEAIQSIPLLWAWIVVMVTNPMGQQLLEDAGVRLLVTLAVALVVEQALRRLLSRPLARVIRLGQPPPGEPEEDPVSRAERGAIEPPPGHDPDADLDVPGGRDAFRLGRRTRLGLARFALRMIPILGLLVAGHLTAASTLGGPPGSRLVILAVVAAIAASQALLALLELLFMPDPPGLKLLPLRPEADAYLLRWGRRLLLIAVPGYTIGEVALLLGLSAPAHGALQKIVGLALTICLAIIVVQRRRSVRRWLSAQPGATGVVPRLRNTLARSWWWIALFLLAANWLAWTLGTPDAFSRTLWFFAVTAAVVLAAAIARTAVLAVLAPIHRSGSPNAEAANDDTAPPPSPVRLRLSAYHSALRRLTTLVIDLLALLALLQLYGVGGLTWLLTSAVGQRIVSGVITLAVTIALAFTVWESVNIAIQMHMETLRREAQAARSARLRTLLPLIRTTLAIAVAVVAGLMVLSEIGVNIAPLLAGAGIVGVAIGFGSQRLVQDVITGMFLLLENTMQVGDVVKVGDQSGLVESLSVRTIRLRTEDGSVVVIPFSGVTTVINMTRDYSRAVLTVNIAAGEDVDRVIETMRDIVREMRAEPAWSAIILDDLEVWGLDRIIDTALQIKCRVMCTPFGRWPVGREFNRRLRGRFEVIPVTAPFSALRLNPPVPAAGEAASPGASSPGTPAAAAGQ